MRVPVNFANPVHPAYLADPFVFKHEGVYYAIGTGEPDSRKVEGRIFPMLRSFDFLSWEPVGGALVPPDPALGVDFWAPEIALSGGTFYLYYSVGFSDKGHQLRVATSSFPGGPYEDVGEPVLDPTSCPFAIDANPFQDRDGNWFLFYARDFLDTDRPGTALAVAPLQDMVRIAPEFTVVMRALHDWQRYQKDRLMYGALYDWHTLEGPCALFHEGRYYVLYSGGNWQESSYGLDYVWSDSVTGPYVDDNQGSPRILRTVPGKVIGPGHNSLVSAPDGETKLIAYHAWDPEMTARRLFFDELVWTADGPRSHGPTWAPRVVEWL
jgi:beta-xylosidase